MQLTFCRQNFEFFSLGGKKKNGREGEVPNFTVVCTLTPTQESHALLGQEEMESWLGLVVYFLTVLMTCIYVIFMFLGVVALTYG